MGLTPPHIWTMLKKLHFSLMTASLMVYWSFAVKLSVRVVKVIIVQMKMPVGAVCDCSMAEY